jgi:putative ABC transport system substrate-binding protein
MTLKRRSFVAAATWAALGARAQRGHTPVRIALVFLTSPADRIGGADPADPYARAVVHGLRDLGLVEGRSIVIERRSAEGRFERLPALMQEMVALDVDVIVTSGPGVEAAQRATERIPIVGVVDGALDGNLVASLARPGRNFTGIGIESRGFAGKQLQLLKEAAPAISRVAVIAWSPVPGRPRARWREDFDAAARSMLLEVRWLAADTVADFERAFAAVVRERANALFVTNSALNFAHVQRIAEFAMRERLPSVSQWREFAEAGGLLSYGTNELGDLRHTATFVKRILDGAKPADLPFEQPTRFELVINRKAAKVLGLTIPQALLLRADEVIE